MARNTVRPSPQVPTDAPTTSSTLPAVAISRLDASPKVVRHAYADLWILLLIACWSTLSGSLVQFAALCGFQDPRLWQIVIHGQVIAAAAAFVWLCYLVIGRTPWNRRRPIRRLAIRSAAVITGAAFLYTSLPAAIGAYPLWLTLFVQSAAVAWLALEVCRSRGITPARLGICPPGARTPAGRVEAWEIGNRVVAACIMGGGAAMVLLVVLRWAPLGLPVMRTTQTEAIGLTSTWDLLPAVLWTVVSEDLVIVAAIAALATAARRSTWEIYAIVCCVEIAVHLYMGLPALGYLPYAWYRVRLYLRYGRLTPLVVGHALFDVAGLSTQGFPLASKLLLGLAVVVIHELCERLVNRYRIRAVQDQPAETIGAR
ncbi:hypothetical protein OIE62_06850 [Streptomyces scopuliridis]|uniref:Uncharacterized protein n=1 Tax=Streptomyces scopuliridis TaxID=452529 RepID=A0ACD4ZU50_9ACTN|nr:hypothetical protein [Streptomyces scopuliridis]WSC01701.1 hypothetical protein OG835_34970 [Streptomyces scopuliridis]WSC04760.1 hypothetical protein OIE62_06850 [Streptomyces scopuliridis]